MYAMIKAHKRYNFQHIAHQGYNLKSVHHCILMFETFSHTHNEEVDLKSKEEMFNNHKKLKPLTRKSQIMK